MGGIRYTTCIREEHLKNLEKWAEEMDIPAVVLIDKALERFFRELEKSDNPKDLLPQIKEEILLPELFASKEDGSTGWNPVHMGLYGLMMGVLADPARESILRLLSGHSASLSFAEIKDTLKIQSNDDLSCHLNVLQQACLIERITDFNDPRTAKDPYHYRCTLSMPGRSIVPTFWMLYTKRLTKS